METQSNTVVPLDAWRRKELAFIHEANHRIANHLSLLVSLVQVQANGVSKGPDLIGRDDVRDMLKGVASKVFSVSHLHRKLADRPQSDRINLGDYLIESCQALITSLSLQGQVGIVHQLHAHCLVTAEQAQQITLVASEIIMNAVKHAHPSGIPVEISLSCSRDSRGRLVLEIGDDGIGLPESFDHARDGGVGFRVVRSLAASLEAELTVLSDMLGTTFRLCLPLDCAATA
ncbi:MAG: signal transduction histidine kinase, partial [Gammaproteobacteria bacterium]|nr:signal transduction histidine kinase [Gammaproteobacteria bacterium]